MARIDLNLCRGKKIGSELGIPKAQIYEPWGIGIGLPTKLFFLKLNTIWDELCLKLSMP